jgi:hypothetical protein
MSSLAFLVTELQVHTITACAWSRSDFVTYFTQSLSSETRRKHPEVREVGGYKLRYILFIFIRNGILQAAEKSLAILRASPEQATASLAAGESPSLHTNYH